MTCLLCNDPSKTTIQNQSGSARLHAVVKRVYGLAPGAQLFILKPRETGRKHQHEQISTKISSMRIAMWSGPRNLSTAMMYSFGARADFSVMDEPFYAPFLKATGNDHPMRDEILAAHETDPEKVANACRAPVSTPHLYMKHMPHHMVPGFPLDWAQDCVNIHLIRHPARVIASYSAKWDGLTLDQIGFVQQATLYEQLGGVVIDSFDIRQNPEKALRRLCSEIGLSFDPAMLSWPAGRRAEDGIWAAHWYGAVHRSTGFAGAEGPLPDVTGHHAELLENALPHYMAMAALALKP